MNVVLITGCSSGIGLEAALAFARAGDCVYASMRDVSKAENLTEAADREGLTLNILGLDVTRSETFPKIIERIVDEAGRLDILVNNAGLLPLGAFEDIPESEFRHVMETNFFGSALLTRAALPFMRQQNNGYIIMISSLSGMASKAGDCVYAASKFALEGLTEGLRQEISRWNIKTALVEPGQYATQMFRGVNTTRSDPDSPYYPLTSRQIEDLSKQTGAGYPPQNLAELLVRISRSDGTRLRWPADDVAERVMTTVFAQDDAERQTFLRDVANVDWWINGKDQP